MLTLRKQARTRLYQSRLHALEGARVQPRRQRAVQRHALQQAHDEVAEELQSLMKQR